MKYFGLVVVWVALLFPVSASRADHMVYPASEEALISEFEGMYWESKPGTYALEKSKSSLRLPEGLSILTGDVAERYAFLSQGIEFPQTEAVVVDDRTETFVWFEYYDDGYVTLDDWSDVDPDVFLEEMIEGQKIANVQMIENGVPPLTVKGWSREPSLDRTTNSVLWAIAVQAEGDPTITVNVAVLSLGRRGYEQITWVGSATQYVNTSDKLIKAMQDGHVYNQGLRYADYETGDMVAAVGIGALVATAVGASSTKSKGFWAGILAFLLLVLKKGWIVVVLVIGGAWAGIRRIFGGRRTQHTPPDQLD